MRANYPKKQPAYGEWLRRAMVHCNHRPTTLAKKMQITPGSVNAWTGSGRRIMPRPHTAALAFRVLVDTWPTDKEGKRVPLPASDAHPPVVAGDLEAELLAALLDNFAGSYLTSDIIAAAKDNSDLLRLLEATSPSLHPPSIGRLIARVAKMSGGAVKVSGWTDGKALWSIDDIKKRDKKEVAEPHFTELKKAIALVRTQDFTSQSERLCRIEALLEALTENQAKLLKAWGVE